MTKRNEHLTCDELDELTERRFQLQYQAADLESMHIRKVAQERWHAVGRGTLTPDEARNDVYAAMESSTASKYRFELPAGLEAELDAVNRRLYPEEYLGR